MTIQEAIQCRHSVRAYLPRPIEGEPLARLEEEIRQCNQDSGLRIQLITDDPVAFGGRMAHYGKFEGVHSYLALVGPKGPRLEETCGWYGERLVLLAQQLGLNTCWVALTYKKNKSRITISPGEKLACVIAIGYGAAQGVPHRSKPAEAVCRAGEPGPPWFRARGGFARGLAAGGSGLSTVLAPLLLEETIQHLGLTAAFWLEGGVGILLTLCVFLLVRDRP